MPVYDEFKEEREEIKNADFKTKLSYFWDYYKFHTLGGLFVIIVLSIFIYERITAKDTVLNVALCNTITGDSPTVQEEFPKYAGINTKKEKISLDDSYAIDLEGTSQASVYSMQKLTAYVSASELDMMVGSVDVISYYAYQDDFMELDKVLPKEDRERPEGQLFYIDKAVVEECQQALSEMKDTEEIEKPDPFKPELMKEPVCVGIVLDQEKPPLSTSFYVTNAEEGAVFAVLYNAPHTDMCRKFMEYMIN
ncbi:MAG: hypothetical protein K6F84_04125 [Lachnospiraceae bacterium]|nr:hypothetical protein [Lachnospiraceae bacterium]